MRLRQPKFLLPSICVPRASGSTGGHRPRVQQAACSGLGVTGADGRSKRGQIKIQEDYSAKRATQLRNFALTSLAYRSACLQTTASTRVSGGTSRWKNRRKARGAKASLARPKFVRVFVDFFSEMSRCPSTVNNAQMQCLGGVNLKPRQTQPSLVSESRRYKKRSWLSSKYLDYKTYLAKETKFSFAADTLRKL